MVRNSALATAKRWPSIGRAILLVHLFLSPLVFCRATAEVFEANKVALLLLATIVLATLGLSGVIGQSLRTPVAGWGDPLNAGVWLVLFAAVASTAASVSPRTSLLGAPESHGGLLTVLGYFAVFMATRALCRSLTDGRLLLGGALAAAAIAGAYALVQATGLDPLAWDDVSRVGGYTRPFATLGHPNQMEAYLVMVLPISAEFTRRAAANRNWFRAVVGLVSSSVFFVAIVASLSRGAWLALAAVLAAVLIGWLGAGQRRAAACLSIMGATFAFGLFATNTGFRDSLSVRLKGLGDVTSRKYLWRAGLEMFRDRPLLGCGLDSFQLAFAAKRSPAYWEVEWNATPAKSHNEFIHVLATQGGLGGLAVLVLTAGIVWAARRAWQRALPPERPLIVAVCAGVIGFCVQNLVNFTVVATGTLFVTFAALLGRWAVGPQPAHSPSAGLTPLRWVLHTAVVAAALWLVNAGVVRPLRASLACSAGDHYLTSDAREAVKRFERAVAFASARDIYWVKLGTAAQVAAQTLPPSSDCYRLFDRARQAFARALELVPANSYHHANLGRLLGVLAAEGLAVAADAFVELDRALELDPNNACFHVDAAHVALRLGDAKRARAYAERGLAQYPRFGPLRAIAGYLALQSDRPTEAVGLLGEALQCEWHSEKDACRLAATTLVAVLRRLGRQEDANHLARSLIELWPDQPDVRRLTAHGDKAPVDSIRTGN
jgi:O-antigen ligase